MKHIFFLFLTIYTQKKHNKNQKYFKNLMPVMMVFVCNPRIQLAVAGGLEKLMLHSKYQASQDSTAIPCRKRENRRGNTYVLQNNSKD